MSYHLIHGDSLTHGDIEDYRLNYCIVKTVKYSPLKEYVRFKDNKTEDYTLWVYKLKLFLKYNKIHSYLPLGSVDWISRYRIIEDNIIVGFGNPNKGIVCTFDDIKQLPELVEREIIMWELAK